MEMVDDTKTEALPEVVKGEVEVGEYYFESDPLALKGNSDYQHLIKALVKLQSQRVKAVKDLEELQEVQEVALNDPLNFVQALQNGQYNYLPGLQDITPIPNIDWKKYGVHSLVHGKRPKTRNKHSKPLKTEIVPEKVEGENGKIKVRGRVYNELKPQTFNQPWTEEEQRMLEELLIKYPDEPIAFRRYAKISEELGTRTPLQVQSRVQKYFIMLKREGFPVPGRNPSTSLIRRFATRRRSLGHRTHVSSSSFMRAFNMSEEQCCEIPLRQKTNHCESTLSRVFDESISDEEDIAVDLRDTEEYQELMKLKQIQRRKINEVASGLIVHPGFSCDVCGCDPIHGVRWHCTDCVERSTDFCNSCDYSTFSSGEHTSSHKLRPIRCMSVKDSLDVL